MSILSSILLRSPFASGSQVSVTKAPGGTTSHAGELFYGWDFALSSGSMFGMDVLAIARFGRCRLRTPLGGSNLKPIYEAGVYRR